MIEITRGIYISEDELVFRASRSGGPGGQNVNKLSTRVRLLFDVANCRSFSEVQKQQILKTLATRANRNGVIRVVSQKFRSQRANRQAAVGRLGWLLAAALKSRPPRIKTGVPERAHDRRLKAKKQRSMLKQQRAKNWAEDLPG
jgi:ribosome-associated protein